VSGERGWITLGSKDLHAEVDPLGAQLSILRDSAGRDLLWDGDPAVWKGRAPLLFPIVGELAGGAYRVNSRSYHLPRHGFARTRRFELADSSGATADFTLSADPASLEIYPFHFSLGISYRVQGPTLTLAASIRNTGPAPLPASFGYHPAFRWPLPYGQERSRHFIEFELDEPAPVRRLDAQGLLTPARHPTPIAGRRLALADSLFEADALIFDEIRSRSATYGADTGPRLRVGFFDAPFLGVWTKPGARFICVEPWHGLADPEGFTGELGSKPGIFSVPPGGTRRIEVSITLLGI